MRKSTVQGYSVAVKDTANHPPGEPPSSFKADLSPAVTLRKTHFPSIAHNPPSATCLNYLPSADNVELQIILGSELLPPIMV